MSSGKLHQHERELEREPGVRLLRSLGEHLAAGLIDRLGGVRGAAPGDLTLHALVGHHLVHEPEAAQRLGVGEQVLQPGRELIGHLAGLGDGVQALGAQVFRKLLRPAFLAIQPGRVTLHDRAEPVAKLGGGRFRQRGHVEHRVDLVRHDLRCLTDRQPGGPHGGCPPLAVGHLPVHRAGPSDRELQPVPVLKVEPAQLVVFLAVVIEQRVADRQERVRSTRRDH